MLNLDAALQKAVKDAEAPGAVALVGNMDGDLYLGATGFAQTTPAARPATVNTPYDLASVTKVVATATSIMMLRDAGKLDLDQPVDEIVPIDPFSRFTIRHLLTHTSGLPSHKVWYKQYTSLNAYLQGIAALDLGWKPGTYRNYSDLGFMILAKVVELAGQEPLDRFALRNIYLPLKMGYTTFNPPEDWAATCAATELCAWRGQVMVGKVHDENAYAMGGVSGHAGLFSSAPDLAIFCRALLGGKILKRETLDEMLSFKQCPPYPWQGLGWTVDPWIDSVEGFLPARRAFGHTGWTGTCLWIDPDAGNFGILLSNTCHPSRARRFNRTLRGVFFKQVARQLYPTRTNAHTGLDCLAWKRYDPLSGKRAAILTHAAATDAYGRLLPEVLGQNTEVMIARYYSPEHGFTGQAEAGAAVASQQGARIPVISLYGGQSAPAPDELKDIDYFVVDVQDIGARYYTYAATVKACLEACAKAKKPMLVLDRPNPLGGLVLEGPIAQQTQSLVCWSAVPVRHGMTLGEAATWFANNDLKALKPSVIVWPLDNWPRDFMHHQCALPWTPPSPNMPAFETALAYIGTCLLEGTNISEGRGTDEPFLQFGAPWLDPAKLLAELKPEDYPGMLLGEWSYTPRQIPGKASDPKYHDELCRGVKLRITEPDKVRAFRTIAAMLAAIRRHQPGELVFTDFFDTLAGGPRLREQLLAGAPAAEITAAFEAQHPAYDTQRPKLYPAFNDLYA